MQEFFSVNFPLREFFFFVLRPPSPPHKFSNGPSLTRVKFACVYKVEEMYEKAACKLQVEEGSTLTFTRDLPYIAFMLFTRVKFARERT